MKPDYTKNAIEGIRYQLDSADKQPRPEAQLGMTMIAVGRLVDLCERLHQRIVDLERVQNERSSE